jgi:hypothetical protein
MIEDLMPTPKINPFDSRNHRNVVASVPAQFIPSYNIGEAFKAGTANSFMVNSWGGLGDQICAEPAIRFGMRTFKGVSWHLAGRCPSIYSHLKWDSVTDTRKKEPDWNSHLVFQTIVSPDHLMWEFFSHLLVQAVDYASMCMFRMALPVADKEIQLPDFKTGNADVERVLALRHSSVVIHAGKSWPSKTFPKAWWDEVVKALTAKNFTPVLVGASVKGDVGFVDVDPAGCIDLRDRLSIPEFIELLKGCKLLLSNDSSPIHAAAAGDAFIGMIATCKHPDFITHWRQGKFGYKTKNFGLDGAWNYDNYSPAQEEGSFCDNLPAGVMEKILPEPARIAAEYETLTRMWYP